MESILDECLSIGMPKLSLNWHYRSRHESLIAFSNVTYYENRLVTFPSPVTEDRAVRFERVHGIYDRGDSVPIGQRRMPSPRPSKSIISMHRAG